MKAIFEINMNYRQTEILRKFFKKIQFNAYDSINETFMKLKMIIVLNQKKI